mmetsp:Transcript_2880/g.5400  ORF Transcript_2880/g.5400 Transcript_2880/m.5400 type:complete len:381 (+) Transcript_2880:489-1631(+)|eukprot:CAMPEP_0176498058 /NCGR_PEP_ID=MMETSP0200_2-20121128/12092_1 /TAXON_ID=947934 /ORGANISM="Chaetoceros sp., Strain GSL56" /LENGTH=380 /DNA_ID=CAMNT_0017896187 /DNA_START=482 /DNA_END=1624 /DNA_ORIENTATION=-
MGNQPSNVTEGVASGGGTMPHGSLVTGQTQRSQHNQGQRHTGAQSQHPHSVGPNGGHLMHGQQQQQQQVPYGPGPYGTQEGVGIPMGHYAKSSSDASMGEDLSSQRLPFGVVSQIQRQSFDNASSSVDIHHPATVHDPSVQANIAQLSSVDDDVVPTVFRWEHGGREVYITGTFNGWTRQIPMHRSGNDFTYIHNLKRGKHAYKFIVDDEWRFAPDQPTVADVDGRINNFIDVTEFKPYTGDKSFETEKNAAYYCRPYSSDDKNGQNGMAINDDDVMADGMQNIAQYQDPDGEIFTHNMPDLDDYTKDPPPLPPHLRHIILNKPPQLQDTAALPVPQHVALNHLYCTAIRDNMMVLGITQRFRTKFVTTVYYSPELSRPM